MLSMNQTLHQEQRDCTSFQKNPTPRVGRIIAPTYKNGDALSAYPAFKQQFTAEFWHQPQHLDHTSMDIAHDPTNRLTLGSFRRHQNGSREWSRPAYQIMLTLFLKEAIDIKNGTGALMRSFPENWTVKDLELLLRLDPDEAAKNVTIMDYERRRGDLISKEVSSFVDFPWGPKIDKGWLSNHIRSLKDGNYTPFTVKEGLDADKTRRDWDIRQHELFLVTAPRGTAKTTIVDYERRYGTAPDEEVQPIQSMPWNIAQTIKIEEKTPSPTITALPKAISPKIKPEPESPSSNITAPSKQKTPKSTTGPTIKSEQSQNATPPGSPQPAQITQIPILTKSELDAFWNAKALSPRTWTKAYLAQNTEMVPPNDKPAEESELETKLLKITAFGEYGFHLMPLTGNGEKQLEADIQQVRDWCNDIALTTDKSVMIETREMAEKRHLYWDSLVPDYYQATIDSGLTVEQKKTFDKVMAIGESLITGVPVTADVFAEDTAEDAVAPNAPTPKQKEEKVQKKGTTVIFKQTYIPAAPHPSPATPPGSPFDHSPLDLTTLNNLYLELDSLAKLTDGDETLAAQISQLQGYIERTIITISPADLEEETAQIVALRLATWGTFKDALAKEMKLQYGYRDLSPVVYKSFLRMGFIVKVLAGGGAIVREADTPPSSPEKKRKSGDDEEESYDSVKRRKGSQWCTAS
ncbi:uncharacterized protein PAC_11194 [Phialocephala subalpina]|uniref:Uncharacterized protein n=1 Tax=Phialocephala subalpina TaxID=576137 RepID=A0A1L7X8E8_9HELO|nr:uncharacterized protein PAC_11194 [Phialocephala subalpina]